MISPAPLLETAARRETQRRRHPETRARNNVASITPTASTTSSSSLSTIPSNPPGLSNRLELAARRLSRSRLVAVHRGVRRRNLRHRDQIERGEGCKTPFRSPYDPCGSSTAIAFRGRRYVLSGSCRALLRSGEDARHAQPRRVLLQQLHSGCVRLLAERARVSTLRVPFASVHSGSSLFSERSRLPMNRPPRGARHD